MPIHFGLRGFLTVKENGAWLAFLAGWHGYKEKLLVSLIDGTTQNHFCAVQQHGSPTVLAGCCVGQEQGSCPKDQLLSDPKLQNHAQRPWIRVAGSGCEGMFVQLSLLCSYPLLCLLWLPHRAEEIHTLKRDVNNCNKSNKMLGHWKCHRGAIAERQFPAIAEERDLTPRQVGGGLSRKGTGAQAGERDFNPESKDKGIRMARRATLPAR